MTTVLDNIAFIPAELKALKQWVCWGKKGHKNTKAPWQPNGKPAKANDPETWATWQEALDAVQKGKFAGTGFEFAENGGYVGIDLDNSADQDTGVTKLAAATILEKFPGTYAELSPSGRGIHIICRGVIPDGVGRKRGDVEVYDRGRYFTMTGAILGDTPAPILDCQEAIDWLCAAIDKKRPPHIPAEMARQENKSKITKPASAGCIERCRSYLTKLPDSRSGEPGAVMFTAACTCARFGLSPQQAMEMARWFNQEKTPPGNKWTEKELQHKVDDAYQRVQDDGEFGKMETHETEFGPDIATPGEQDVCPKSECGKKGLPSVIQQQLTDQGNARKLAANYCGLLRHIDEWNQWITWNGKKWVRDSGTAASLAAFAINEQLSREAENENIKSWRKARMEWARLSRGYGHLAAMPRLAKSLLACNVGLLDCHPWLLNVNNGTLDLRTMELQPHSPSLLITQLAPVDFDPSAKSEIWDEFLAIVFAGADETKEYVQRVMGYSLTGCVTEHILPVIYGSGSNGKSSFVNLFMKLLGDDYAMQATPELLMPTKNAIPEEKAKLRGIRLVSTIETSEYKEFDEEIIKSLTGGDKITARELYGHYFSFWPSHTVLLSTNHKPRVSGTDVGIWRRLKVVDFLNKISKEMWNERFEGKLFTPECFSAALNWAVEGCKNWQINGLQEPSSVVAASIQYQQEQDLIGQAIQEILKYNPDIPLRQCVSRRDLYDAYKTWCHDAGLRYPASAIKFNRSLRERGFEDAKDYDGIHRWRDIIPFACGRSYRGTAGTEVFRS